MKSTLSTDRKYTDQQTDLPDILSKPALRAFHALGYTTLKQFTKISEQEMLQLHGVGPNAIVKIKEALAAKGLVFTK